MTRTLTVSDVYAAVGTPAETSVKLDYTLQAYARREHDLNARNAQIRRMREAARRAFSAYMGDDAAAMAAAMNDLADAAGLTQQGEGR